MNNIGWCDETINPIIGCSMVSEGCENCYAERMAHRLSKNPMVADRYRQVVENGRWAGKTEFVKTELLKPVRWKTPKKIFVGSMGDIFHVSSECKWILGILNMAYKNPHHIFILLTKRPENALKVFGKYGLLEEFNGQTGSGEVIPRNIWFGVTCETQKWVNERLPVLSQIPAAVRFISVEPMLGEIELRSYCPRCKGFLQDSTSPNCGTCHGKTFLPDWVICGAETGPKKRHMEWIWARKLMNQCLRSEIPFFFKKWSGNSVDPMHRQFPKIWKKGVM